MPVTNGTLLHKKKGAAINLLFLHDYSPYSMKKRNSPAEEDDFTMLTRSLSRRRDASKEFPQPYPPMRAYPTAIGAWRRLPCEAITKGGFFSSSLPNPAAICADAVR